ncbi:hypothetical protein ACQKK5_07970 [Brevibacillus panacihumi]|uniref:hypothetical protein n=1 Tax=Brevibacillus panacihumi TaxID=497735 RepID=UPI003D08EBFF
MSNTNTTILTDENGVLREYREVKRKANVGERIKMTDTYDVGYDAGDVFSVRNVDTLGRARFYDNDGDERAAYAHRYVVLEPTSTVIINGVRYREEKRKASVGEKVLVVDPEDNLDYEAGDVFTVIGTPHYDREVEIRDRSDEINGLYHREYVVLTPISEPTPTPTVINLAITVNVQPGADVAQAVADAVKAEMARVVAPSPQSAADFVSYASELLGIAKASKTPQELRDEIVERAKADVAELALDDEWNQDRRRESGKQGPFYLFDGVYGTYAEFIVNRDKRTVACLLRGCSSHKVRSRGIAKCAPGDVFSEEIGKVIALYRALGLSVPSIYTN